MNEDNKDNRMYFIEALNPYNRWLIELVRLPHYLYNHAYKGGSENLANVAA